MIHMAMKMDDKIRKPPDVRGAFDVMSELQASSARSATGGKVRCKGWE